MKRKQYKKALLNDKDDQDDPYGFIEMQDLGAREHGYGNQSNTNNYPYFAGEICPDKSQYDKYKKGDYKPDLYNNHDAQQYVNPYAYVDSRAYFNGEVPIGFKQGQQYVYPKTIKMNGLTFKKVEETPKQKKPKFPAMQVKCQHCRIIQQVPGNTYDFRCYHCQKFNTCIPVYGMFYCGKCQGKVAYKFGTSDKIKCTRCSTINKVETIPAGGKFSESPIMQPSDIHRPVITDFGNYQPMQLDYKQKLNPYGQQSQIQLQNQSQRDLTYW